jgi:glutathione S-transferase
MPNLTLYHSPQSRSGLVRWLLEEIGEPYDLHVLNIKKGESRAPAHLAVNPMGKVPAIKHGDVVVTEAAAICCYLADEFPRAGLNVPTGDKRRGPYLQWLFFGPSCIEPAMMDRAFKRAEEPPRSSIGYSDADSVAAVVAGALRPGPYLLGEQFTAADIIIGSGLRWGTMWKLLPARPEFAAYLSRLTERPAFKRTEAADAELAAKQSA